MIPTTKQRKVENELKYDINDAMIKTHAIIIEGDNDKNSDYSDYSYLYDNQNEDFEPTFSPVSLESLTLPELKDCEELAHSHSIFPTLNDGSIQYLIELLIDAENKKFFDVIIKFINTCIRRNIWKFEEVIHNIFALPGLFPQVLDLISAIINTRSDAKFLVNQSEYFSRIIGYLDPDTKNAYYALNILKNISIETKFVEMIPFLPLIFKIIFESKTRLSKKAISFLKSLIHSTNVYCKIIVTHPMFPELINLISLENPHKTQIASILHLLIAIFNTSELVYSQNEGLFDSLSLLERLQTQIPPENSENFNYVLKFYSILCKYDLEFRCYLMEKGIIEQLIPLIFLEDYTFQIRSQLIDIIAYETVANIPEIIESLLSQGLLEILRIGLESLENRHLLHCLYAIDSVIDYAEEYQKEDILLQVFNDENLLDIISDISENSNIRSSGDISLITSNILMKRELIESS